MLQFEVVTAVIVKKPSSGMLRRVALVRTDVSEKLTEAPHSSEWLVLARATRRNIPDDIILHTQ
jgi:hypothetical protein